MATRRRAPSPGSFSGIAGAPGAGAVSQVERLDELPVPDYGDYFTLLGSFPPEKTFLPKIPMEISRGCWWRKSDPTGKGSGCAFCNLNLQWRGYRAKTAHRVVKEINALVNRHHVLSVSFMDNLLPAAGLTGLFDGIKGLGKDLRLFSEIRAATPRNVLSAMGSAGMREVQVGIEALSTSLLKKLNKGATAMDNMEIMKHCETPGMPDLTGNLILTFPSSDASDVKETLHNLDFAFPLSPLEGHSLLAGLRQHRMANAGRLRYRTHPQPPLLRSSFSFRHPWGAQVDDPRLSRRPTASAAAVEAGKRQG